MASAEERAANRTIMPRSSWAAEDSESSGDEFLRQVGFRPERCLPHYNGNRGLIERIDNVVKAEAESGVMSKKWLKNVEPGIDVQKALGNINKDGFFAAHYAISANIDLVQCLMAFRSVL